MGEYRHIDQRITEAAARWTGLELKRKTHDEAAGPCPFCGGDDRFRIWAQGNYECRPGPGHCGRAGWLDEDNRQPLTEHDKLRLRVEALERKQAEMERRLSALEQMHACRDHIWYHQQMPDEAWQYWYEAGLWPETIRRYQLGYCRRCPTDHDGRASYTIPVISNGQLWNIRHRLVDAPDGDKYRPHLAGLPSVLFNADYLRGGTPDILIVEGEKKSIVAAQEGLANVGVMGKSGFAPEWARLFAGFQRVIVCYDPDGIDKATEVARLFERRGRVVELPVKLDDLITQYRATAEDLRWFIEFGRPV